MMWIKYLHPKQLDKRNIRAAVVHARIARYIKLGVIIDGRKFVRYSKETIVILFIYYYIKSRFYYARVRGLR